MKTEWFKNLARLFLPVYQYESDTMRIGYAGYSSIKKNYFIRHLLNSNNPPVFVGRKLCWQIPGLIRTHNLDFLVSEISPVALNYYQKQNGYVIPEWIKMRINIDKPISEICHRSISDFPDIMRKIRKYDLTYELLNGKENVDNFYEKFYLPYLSKRHNAEAWIEDLNTLREASLISFIIAIREKGVTVGMCLVHNEDDSFFLTRLGLLDGNDEYRQHGVIGAIYYFCILEAQKLGCRYLQVGGTRAFLTDGLTKFKKGLGAEFITNLSPKKNTFLWLGVNEKSIVAAEFIRDNPVMHINKDFFASMSET